MLHMQPGGGPSSGAGPAIPRHPVVDPMARSLWTEPSELREALSRVADAASCSGRKLMESAGLSWRSLSSWKSGDRTPLPENVRALGQALQVKGERLRRLGTELVEAAEVEARRRSEREGAQSTEDALPLFEARDASIGDSAAGRGS